MKLDEKNSETENNNEIDEMMNKLQSQYQQHDINTQDIQLIHTKPNIQYDDNTKNMYGVPFVLNKSNNYPPHHPPQQQYIQPPPQQQYIQPPQQLRVVRQHDRYEENATDPQSPGPPALTPWTTQRKPNPEPPQHPEAETQDETQPQRGLPHLIDTYTQQQPQSIRREDWHQGSAIVGRQQIPPDIWATMTRRDRKLYLAAHKPKP